MSNLDERSRPRSEPPFVYPASGIWVEGLTAPGQSPAPLNLILTLKDPGKILELGAVIEAATRRINETLDNIGTVHFARFLPIPHAGLLLVITVFDGDFDKYINDFASQLNDEFTAILSYMVDAPRLPVKDHPQEFLEYIRKRNMNTGLYSAYPLRTAEEIRQCP